MTGNGPLERAVDAIRRAVAANPRNAAYRSRLAGLLHRTGDLDGAIAEAEEAIRLTSPSEDDPMRAFLDELRRAKTSQSAG